MGSLTSNLSGGPELDVRKFLHPEVPELQALSQPAGGLHRHGQDHCSPGGREITGFVS